MTHVARRGRVRVFGVSTSALLLDPQTYQVIAAAISRVIMPSMVPSGSERAGERTSSAACVVPSMPR